MRTELERRRVDIRLEPLGPPAVFGAMFFLTYPALFGVASSATDASERGTAFGMIFGFQLGGGAIIVAACGVISDWFQDPSYSFLVMGALGALSVASLAPLRNGSSK